jgi:hypothetical protein
VDRRFFLARPHLLSLLLTAMMLRMLVPAGYMLAPDGAGAPRLVQCDGLGAPPPPSAHAMHQGDHSRPQHAPAHHAQAPCPYAALSAPVLPPLPPLLLPLPIPPDMAAPAAAASSLHRPGAAAPLPPATGPPLQA